MTRRALLRVTTLVAIAAAFSLFGSSEAWAAPGASSGAVGIDPTLINPVVTGPPPVTLAANCPAFLSSDDWALNFTGGGNAVSYGTENKNGDWGGANAEGPASLSMSTGAVEYSGHLHVWFGGGQNSDPNAPPTNQSEQGFTLSFNGSGIAGNISINANIHGTTNNKGVTTSNVMHIDVTCS